MKLIIISYFILAFSIIKAENPCGYMYPQAQGKWGQSLLWIKPGKSIRVYDKPNGLVIGNVEYSLERYCLIYKPDSLLKDVSIFSEDLTWVGHTSVPFLRVLEYNYGFCKVMDSTFVDGCWVKIEEIDNVNVINFKLKDLLFEDNMRFPEEIKYGKAYAKIGVNLNGFLNLRASPSLEAKVLNRIPSNGLIYNSKFISHLEILKTKGNWAYVKVITKKYSPIKGEDNDCAYDLFKVQRGWVKAFRDDGYPNIWFSVTAY